MTYEVNVNEVTIAMTTIFIEDIYANIKQFDAYEIITVELTIKESMPKTKKKRKRKSLEDEDSE